LVPLSLFQSAIGGNDRSFDVDLYRVWRLPIYRNNHSKLAAPRQAAGTQIAGRRETAVISLKIERYDYGRRKAAPSAAPNLPSDCRNYMADCSLLFDLIRRRGYAGAAFTSVLIMIHGQ